MIAEFILSGDAQLMTVPTSHLRISNMYLICLIFGIEYDECTGYTDAELESGEASTEAEDQAITRNSIDDFDFDNLDSYIAGLDAIPIEQ